MLLLVLEAFYIIYVPNMDALCNQRTMFSSLLLLMVPPTTDDCVSWLLVGQMAVVVVFGGDIIHIGLSRE